MGWRCEAYGRGDFQEAGIGAALRAGGARFGRNLLRGPYQVDWAEIGLAPVERLVVARRGKWRGTGQRYNWRQGNGGGRMASTGGGLRGGRELTQNGVYWIVSSVQKKWKPGRGSGFTFVTVKKRRPAQGP